MEVFYSQCGMSLQRMNPLRLAPPPTTVRMSCVGAMLDADSDFSLSPSKSNAV